MRSVAAALDVRVCVLNTSPFAQNCPQIVIQSTTECNILLEEFLDFSVFLSPLQTQRSATVSKHLRRCPPHAPIQITLASN